VKTRQAIIYQRIFGMLGGLILLLVATSMAQECSMGSAFCQGRYGAGCYNPTYAACHDGLVCSTGTSPCVGRYGTGCYNPAYATCQSGLVCAAPLQPCFGQYSARCYDPSRATCAASSPRPRPRH